MANYNSYFPQTYSSSPYVYGAPVSPAQTWTTPNTSASAINWVQGEAGAKSIVVQPGQMALLMDSETNVFYLKSSDASGIPLPLRRFKYEEITATDTPDGSAPSTYITKEELDERLEQFASELKEKTNGKFDI